MRFHLPLIFAVLLSAAGASTGLSDDLSGRAIASGQVAILKTPYTDVAYYVPHAPTRVLVLAHGFPWEDGSQSDDALSAYAEADAARWKAFANQQHVIVLVPALGGHALPNYREMVGRTLGPDEFIDRLVDDIAPRFIQHYDGRFSLHGHSAGAQFAARYLIAHPERLEMVILSAPSTYPMPDDAIPWPYGMARGAGAPKPQNWIRAASDVSVTVLVGSRDTEVRPPSPGQKGGSRLDRARSWVAAMTELAHVRGSATRIRMVEATGLGHDEKAMALPAQSILDAAWHEDPSSHHPDH